MESKLEPVGTFKQIYSASLSLIGLLFTLFAISKYNFIGSGLNEEAYDIRAIGTSLLSFGDNGYVLPFEVISVLLLAAMIAAIMIAKKDR